MTDLNYVRDLSETGVAAANVRRDQAPHGFWHCCVVPLAFRAPPGPAAACARGRRPAREPSAPRASLGASARSPARPRPVHGHRSLALRTLRCPPHQWGVVCCVWWRVDSKPGQASPRPRAPQPGPGLLYVAQRWLSIINFACNSPVACSNIEFASLELQRFQGLLKFGPIELHAKFIWS